MHLGVLVGQKPSKIQNFDVVVKNVNVIKSIEDIHLEKLRQKFVFYYLKISQWREIRGQSALSIKG